MRRPKIEDVAVASGVSVTTVSHVFSGKRPVNKATRLRVEEVAQRLGYRPNAIAQSLRKRRTNTVMLVVPDITNPFYPAFARGAQDGLRQHGYLSLLCNTDGRADEERAFLEEAAARRLDGVIVFGFQLHGDELARFCELGLSIVSIGPPVRGTPIDSVTADDARAARDATSYLLDQTDGPVALIDGARGTPVADMRRSGYLQAHTERGLRPARGAAVFTDFTRAGGAAGMRTLLQRRTPPRAVFCANDLLAIGALDVLHEHGLRVPDDVAVVGCDDIEAAAMVTPPLTTVCNPTGELGARSSELLVSRMSGEYTGPGRHVVVPHRLILRASA